MKKNKVIFWDFGGTLADRKDVFSDALLRVMDENIPNHKFEIDNIKKHLKGGFPWHETEKEYTHLIDPLLWWEVVEKRFEDTYLTLGLNEKDAKEYSRLAHMEFIKPDKFILYDDTLDVLRYFKTNGWKNIILSNHVPELPDIVKGIGLDSLIDKCISSATAGYEKPNPNIYRIALEIANNPDDAWMVGDSIEADIYGAERAGIKAVLVRNPKVENIKYSSEDLHGLLNIIA